MRIPHVGSVLDEEQPGQKSDARSVRPFQSLLEDSGTDHQTEDRYQKRKCIGAAEIGHRKSLEPKQERQRCAEH